MQVEFPKSIIPANLGNMLLATDRGHILVDFPIHEINVERRKTVAETYSKDDFPAQFGDYVLVAIIKESGDHLMVPPMYGRCTIAQKPKPSIRPNSEHVNHADFVKLLTEKNNATA